MSQGYTKGIPIDTDPQLSLDSDFLVASQKAVKAYVAAYQGSANNAAALGGIPAASYALKVELVPGFNQANLAYQQANTSLYIANLAFDQANSANVLAFDTGIGANAFASATIAGANAAVGAGANSYAATVGVAANSFASATIAGANSAVGTGANSYAAAVGTSANAFTSATIAGANTAVGAGANTVGSAAFAKANTANITADLAFNKANAANVLAFNALPNTSGVTFAGNLTIAGDLNVSNAIVNVDSIRFDQFANVAVSANGQLAWNEDEYTLDLMVDTTDGGTIMQIGQEIYYRVKNQTGNTITNGTVVMAAGTVGSSGRILVTPAISNGTYPSKYVMGVATQNIPDGDDGFVTAFGKVRQIDTSMFSDGDILYAHPSIPGALANTMPTAPNTKTTVAIVVHSHPTNGVLFIRPTYGSKLNEDELVELTTLANNDMLVYVTANSRFENKTQTSLLPYILAQDAYNKANSANVLAYNTGIGANAFASATIDGANVISSAAFDKANAANVLAFNALPKTGGTISGDLVVQGNATFSGTTTYANTQTLLIGDNILTLNADLPVAVAPSENAGIEINRGSSANVSLIWNEAQDKWNFTNDGTTYYAIPTNAAVESVTTVASAAYDKANSANSLAYNTGIGANAFASATIAGANTAVGAGANAYAATAAAGANAYMIAVQNGSNTAVGTGANSYAATVGTSANAFASATIAGANTAVGAGANTVGSAAFNKANSANIIAVAAFDKANNSGVVYVKKTTNYTAVSGDGIIADTSAGPFSVTLPLSPVVGNQVVIVDGNDWSANTLTVLRNGQTIENIAEDLIMDIGGVSVTFLFDGNTWETYTQMGVYGLDSSIRLANTVNLAFDTANAAFNKANAANVLAFNTGVGANAFTSATIAGANAAVGAGANSYAATAAAGANAYMIAVQNGSNTAVGAGANSYAATVGTSANTFASATIAGANTAVGTGANAFTSATVAGANTISIAAFAQANTALDTAVAMAIALG